MQIIRHPHSLTILEDTLYWADRETRTISSCDKWYGNDEQRVVVTGLSEPTDLISYHPVRQPNGKY